MESRIDIVNMGENMKKKNANISHIAQNHAITRKHFGKLESYEIRKPAFEKERYLYKFNLTQLYDRR